MSFDLALSGDGKIPSLTSHLTIGPEEYIAGRAMRYVRNGHTGRYFRIGRRESFILLRLNGECTFEELASQYGAAFGRRLTAPSLASALGTFARGGLLGDRTDEAGRESVPIVSAPPAPLSFKLASWNPEWALRKLAPLARLFDAPVLLAWGVIVAASEFALLPHLTEMWALSTGASSLPLRFAILFLLQTFMLFLHEGAHALACKRHGGEVREVGLMFKYLGVRAYTKIDDILLFPRRLDRLYVLLAGPLVSLTLIPAAYLGWVFSSPHGFAHLIFTDILIWYNLMNLIQFIPFLQLDGYFMLAQVLRMPDLMRDSYFFLSRAIAPGLFAGRGTVVAEECPSYVKPVYAVYGSLSVLVTIAAVAYAAASYSQRLFNAVGAAFGSALVAAAVVAVLIRFAWRLWRWNKGLA